MWILGLFALWGTQLVHAFFAGWRHRESITLTRILLIGPPVFLASWTMLTAIFGLAAWSSQLNGDQHGFGNSVPIVSFIAAVLFTMWVLGRLVLERSNNRYANVQLTISVVSLVLVGLINFYQAISRVDGWTSEAAVQHIVSTNPEFQRAKIEQVERPSQTESLDATAEERHYRVLLDGEQRATISVQRVFHGLGWGHSRSAWRGNAAVELADLRDRAARMQYYRDPINLRTALQAFIREHPDTPELDEVREWLADVEVSTTLIEKVESLGGRRYLLSRLPPLMVEHTAKEIELTPEQQVAVEAFRLIESASLSLYYHRFSCDHRDAALSALRELEADEAAAWLSDANDRIAPFLDESQTQLRPDARLDASRMVNRLPHLEHFKADILNRLVVYCDTHEDHFPTRRRP